MTKLELDRQNKELKAELRELKKIAEKVEQLSSELNNTAIGVLAINGELGFVKIKFDFEKNSAMIDKESLVTGKLHDINTKSRFALVDELVKLNKESK